MLMKSLTAGLVGSALLASAAFAQTPSTTTTSPAATTTTTSTTTTTNSTYNGNWRTSKVVGLSVYNDAGDSLGTINDLLTDKNGKIAAAVIGVGGFLGVGERYVAIPFDKVKFVNEPVKMNNSMAAPGGAMTKSTSSSTTTTGAAGGGMAAPAATPAATPNPWYPDHAVISGTKDELKAMPEFKFNAT